MLVLLVGVVALLVGRAGGDGARSTADGAPAAAGSTLEGTLRDPTGSGELRPGDGEPLRDRTELLPAAERRDPPAPGAEAGTLAQLTDVHVRDTASPARVAFLDRLGPPFADTFRPQEPTTLQALAAATRTIDRLGPQLTVMTGDLVDNDQQNELDAALAALRPASAPAAQRRVAPFRATALQRASSPDPFFYRPDVDPPRNPGLLAAAARPFVAPGLRSPVAAVPGNHDVLVGGEVQATGRTNAVAVGDRRLVRPDEDLDVPDDPALAQQTVNGLLAQGRLPGETVPLRADPSRRQLPGAEVVARMREAGLVPPVGGAAARSAAGDGAGDEAAGTGEAGAAVTSRGGPEATRADAVHDVGERLRVVTLDVTSRASGAGPTATSGQVAFLREALAGAGDRWVVVATHEPLAELDDPTVRQVLAGAPRVLATIAGDVHRDRIDPVRSPSGGYWAITTSSLADWPQQARALRVRDTAGGGAVLETWKLDGTGEPLADVGRQLAFLDAQGGRPQGDDGRRIDRNVRLFRPPPG